MGTFDQLFFTRNEALRVPCGDGHRQLAFQTKDLACDNRCYQVSGALLFDGKEQVVHTGDVAIYTHCGDCIPLLSPRRISGKRIIPTSEERVWVEYRVRLDAGTIVAIEPIDVRSRAEVAAGRTLLDHRDPLFRQHFASHFASSADADLPWWYPREVQKK